MQVDHLGWSTWARARPSVSETREDRGWLSWGGVVDLSELIEYEQKSDRDLV